MANASAKEPMVPSVGVQIDGTPLDVDTALWVTNVFVEDDVDLPGMFSVELASKEKPDGTATWTDDRRFVLGALLDVSMGYGDDRESLMVGEITAIEPTFSVDRSPLLVVRGFDKRHRLNTVRRTRTFTQAKDSDIVLQIAKEAGVAAEAADSRVVHEYLIQADQTDLEFLSGRARRIHHELVADGATLRFRPTANTAASVVTVSFDDDLIEFRPRMSLVPLTELRVVGWDPREKQTIVASVDGASGSGGNGDSKTAAQHAAAVLGARVESLVRAPVASQAEADQMAAGRFSEAGLDFIRGTGRLVGRTDVRAGRVIEVHGVGARFAGEYYVTSTIHRYTERDGYLTDFRVRRNAS